MKTKVTGRLTLFLNYCSVVCRMRTKKQHRSQYQRFGKRYIVRNDCAAKYFSSFGYGGIERYNLFFKRQIQL
jgi:hypothetical protein